ncbi:MAG: SH3 domain-containing protein [Chloroflexota bacterium]
MRLTGSVGGIILFAAAMLAGVFLGDYLPSVGQTENGPLLSEQSEQSVTDILNPTEDNQLASTGSQPYARENRADEGALLVEIHAEVQNVSGNDSRANAFASGPNAQVIVNVAGTGNAQAIRGDEGEAQVEANVSGEGKALAWTGVGGASELEVEVAGPEGAEAFASTGASPSQPRARSSLVGQRTAGLTTLDPHVVINEPLVNVRSGPSTEYLLQGQVGFGQSFGILGRNQRSTWWLICCVNGDEVWITDQYVDPVGLLQTIDVVSDIEPPPTSTPTSTPTPIPTETSTPLPLFPTNTPTPIWNFELTEATRHSEANTVIIYGWIHSGRGALAGYSLQVVKDGLVLINSANSSANPLGTTRPTQVNSPEDKIYNLKLDFHSISYPNLDPTGNWILQLTDQFGKTVGPPTRYTITQGDQFKELYVNYERR